MNGYAKDFEYFGFIFFFYSNEQEPIHVHVKHEDKESVFELNVMNGELQEIRVRQHKGTIPLPEKDKRIAIDFINKYYKSIVNKWVKFFVMKQAVKSTKIKNMI